jgi:hypothetical protein
VRTLEFLPTLPDIPKYQLAWISAADLDGDGWTDILFCNIDAAIYPYESHLEFFRSLGSNAGLASSRNLPRLGEGCHDSRPLVLDTDGDRVPNLLAPSTNPYLDWARSGQRVWNPAPRWYSIQLTRSDAIWQDAGFAPEHTNPYEIPDQYWQDQSTPTCNEVGSCASVSFYGSSSISYTIVETLPKRYQSHIVREHRPWLLTAGCALSRTLFTPLVQYRQLGVPSIASGRLYFAPMSRGKAQVNSPTESIVSLSFPLEVEDGWPPVSVESLPFRVVAEGFVALVPPVFVKELSVGDVIRTNLEAGGYRVIDWTHVAKSGSTTVWLLRMKASETADLVLAELRDLGCNTVGIGQFGVYSVDVPETVAIDAVDAALAHLDTDAIAVAFPSMRHGQG